MKKYLSLSFIAILAALPFATHAQTDVNASAGMNVSSQQNMGPGSGMPIPPGPYNVPPAFNRSAPEGGMPQKRGEMMGSSTPGRPGVMGRMELPFDRKDMPMRASTTPPVRGEFRNDVMMWREGSTTRGLPPMLTPLIKRFASSTMMDREEFRDRIKEMRQDAKEARLDLFAMKQNLLVEQLTRAIDNLKQIRERISSRIDKEASTTRDMTEAKNLLITADASIKAAETSIQSLANYTPPAAASTEANASTTVDLARPREIGADAIKAVNDARKALNDVVRAIAHAMGLKTGQDRPVPPTATSSSTTQ
jgi:hypothetical protein